MKYLITYYSKTGNTKRVALDLAENLKADVDEIIDLKDRSGIKGWLLSGRDGMKEYLTEIKTCKDPKDYDVVIVGTPVWGWNSTPAVRTYIDKFKKQFKKVIIFITSGDTKPEKTVASLQKLVDKKIDIFEGWNTKELKDKKIYQEKFDNFCKRIKQ